MIRLLFIDDDPQAQKTLSMVLEEEYQVRSCFTGLEGIERVRREDPDVVLLDINLPDIDGLEVLERIRAIPMPPPVIMLTAYSDIKFIVSAVKAGAYDYIVKPYGLKELLGTLRLAVLNSPKASATRIHAGAAAELEALVGESPSIRKLKELIVRFGPSGSPVLVTGESGTGKELVARALHSASKRSGAFMPVNCGAIPEHLVESELFGVERGAYTDAVDRKGAFEQADGGSLFLDEIGEMPPSAQVKLLRALEEKEILRLGSSKPLSINVRIIAATNRNIREMIREKTFREDLYYRLGVLLIEVPPLRERREDIPLLAAHFLQRRGPDSKRLSAEAIHRLTAHPWQGNIRELRNVLERAVLLSSGQEVRAEDIHF